jgi:hypothetical protein
MDLNLSVGQRITTRARIFWLLPFWITLDGSQLLDVEGKLASWKTFCIRQQDVINQIKAVNPNDTVFIADEESGYRKTNHTLKLIYETLPSIQTK